MPSTGSVSRCVHLGMARLTRPLQCSPSPSTLRGSGFSYRPGATHHSPPTFPNTQALGCGRAVCISPACLQAHDLPWAFEGSAQLLQGECAPAMNSHSERPDTTLISAFSSKASGSSGERRALQRGAPRAISTGSFAIASTAFCCPEVLGAGVVTSE